MSSQPYFLFVKNARKKWPARKGGGSFCSKIFSTPHCAKIQFLSKNQYWKIFLNINPKKCPKFSTVFVNHPKCCIWVFQLWHFPPIFVLSKLTCLVTLFDHKLQVFKSPPKWTIFGSFNVLLSTQKANVARFACRLFMWFSNTVVL